MTSCFVKLSEISMLITKGTTPTSIEFDYQQSGINFLKIECFDDSGKYLPGKVAHISNECHNALKRSQLQTDDILFSIAGAIGRVAIVTDEMLPANTNQAIAIIRIRDDNAFLPYVKLALSSAYVKNQLLKKMQGAAQINLSLTDIGNIIIPLPELNQQKEIFYHIQDQFAAIDAMAEKTTRQITDAEALLVRTYKELYESTPYPRKALGEICEIVSGTTPDTNVPSYWDGNVKWITPAEIDSSTIVLSDSKRKITDVAVIDCSLKQIPEGSVILSSRAPIGKVAIAGEPLYCNQGFKNLICSDQIYNKYLFWYLKENTEYLNSLGSGATFKEISKSVVERIEIPLPNIHIQEQIANRMDQEYAAICELIKKLRKQQENLSALRACIFREAFGNEE